MELTKMVEPWLGKTTNDLKYIESTHQHTKYNIVSTDSYDVVLRHKDINILVHMFLIKINNANCGY